MLNRPNRSLALAGYDEAKEKGWFVISIRKNVFAFEKNQ
jgi:hypothetical protein